jgi:hypothetical protein
MQQRCPNCGAPIVPGQRFCGGCGAQLSLACPQCRITVSPGTRFCPNCGATLGGGTPQQPGWGQQQSGGMPPQQPGRMQQPGMPQQPGWAQQPGGPQQPAWSPPRQNQAASSNRPLLLGLLIFLLIGLGTITYLFTPIGDTVKDLLQSVTSGTPAIDIAKPAITAVKSTVGAGVAINWKTDELSSSQVEYGKTSTYGSVMPSEPATDPTAVDAEGKQQWAGVLEHSVTIIQTDLEPEVTYHYRVKSKDKAGNEAVSGDYTFTTLKPVE